MMFGQPQVALNAANPNNDYAVPSSPTDGISGLSFSPSNQYLVASSWAGTVACWETAVQESLGAARIAATPRAQVALAAPALCVDVAADSRRCFAGCADGTAQQWTLGQPAAQPFGGRRATRPRSLQHILDPTVFRFF